MAHIKTLELSYAENERIRKLYTPVREMGQSFIRTIPGNCMLPRAYEKYKEQIYNLQLRPNDIFILTWPKNGSTWAQEMTWLIQNECDVEKLKKTNPDEKSVLLEKGIFVDFLKTKLPGTTLEEALDTLSQLRTTSARLIKSHLPYCLLPPNLLDQCKVVTCLRNPKDTVVSFYHHEKLLKIHGYTGDFATYFDLFMDDLVFDSPYWSFTLDVWRNRQHPNLCLLFFEDLKTDLEGNVRKVANFLEKDLTEGQILSLVENLTFRKMKEHGLVHGGVIKKVMHDSEASDYQSFMRKGNVGDWKNYLTEEMNNRMDEAIEKHFSETGLEFVEFPKCLPCHKLANAVCSIKRSFFGRKCEKDTKVCKNVGCA